MAVYTNQIAWRHDFEPALADAAAQGKAVLLDFSAAPMWTGCARLDAEVYPDPEVARFVRDHFVPVRMHVKEQGADYKRLSQKFTALWTPTTLIVDQSGEERHRIEGFLPAHDFIGQLSLGLARTAFAQGKFGEAERRYREIAERHHAEDVGAEATYWAGVSRYKATHDASVLNETAARLADVYPDSAWRKKSDVWQ